MVSNVANVGFAFQKTFEDGEPSYSYFVLFLFLFFFCWEKTCENPDVVLDIDYVLSLM